MSVRLARHPESGEICALEAASHTLLRDALKGWNDTSAFTDDQVMQASSSAPHSPSRLSCRA
jgi:hypothetical protein